MGVVIYNNSNSVFFILIKKIFVYKS